MKRILVVDDNTGVLEVLGIAFEARGFEVYKLTDGKKVPDTVKDFSPDVILLDVFLEDTNGITICNQLKSQSETKHIPVVMFSAHTNAERVLNLCSANAFVEKPFDINRLTAVIESQLIRVT